jgi:hypothetical protein
MYPDRDTKFPGGSFWRNTCRCMLRPEHLSTFHKCRSNPSTRSFFPGSRVPDSTSSSRSVRVLCNWDSP